MFEKLNRANETPSEGLTSIPDDLLRQGPPLVLRGAFSEWPFVIEASRSAEAAAGYLDRFCIGAPVNTLVYDHYVFQLDGDPTEALAEAHRYAPRNIDPERVAKLKDALRELLG